MQFRVIPFRLVGCGEVLHVCRSSVGVFQSPYRENTLFYVWKILSFLESEIFVPNFILIQRNSSFTSICILLETEFVWHVRTRGKRREIALSANLEGFVDFMHGCRLNFGLLRFMRDIFRRESENSCFAIRLEKRCFRSVAPKIRINAQNNLLC